MTPAIGPAAGKSLMPVDEQAAKNPARGVGGIDTGPEHRIPGSRGTEQRFIRRPKAEIELRREGFHRISRAGLRRLPQRTRRCRAGKFAQAIHSRNPRRIHMTRRDYGDAVTPA